MARRSLPERPDLEQLKRQAQELQQAHRAGLLSAAARIGGAPSTPARPRLAGAAGRAVHAGGQPARHRPGIRVRELGEAEAPRGGGPAAAPGCGPIRGSPTRSRRWTRATSTGCGRCCARTRRWCARAASSTRRTGTLPGRPCSTTSRPTPTGCRCHPTSWRSPGSCSTPGADPNALTVSPGGGNTTMGLIITSAHCSEVEAAAPLMDLLLARGAKLDVRSPEALRDAITNYGFEAAEKMIELGATMDVLAAAALGRMDVLRGLFDAERPADCAARPGRQAAVRTRRGRAGLPARLRGRRAGGGGLPAREGRQLEYDRGQQRHRPAPRDQRRRPGRWSSGWCRREPT